MCIGDRIPEGIFTQMGGSEPETATIDDLFSGDKALLFPVPGAFMPTYSAEI